MQAIACMEGHKIPFYFQRKFAGENVKELLCFLVVMSLLSGSGRHPLFDEA
jgi:hypothetical protein